MNPAINKAQYLIRRELWENRGGVIWTPIIISAVVSVLVILVLALGKLQISGNEMELQVAMEWMEQQGLNETSDQPVQRIDFGSGTIEVTDEKQLGFGGWEKDPAVVIPRMQHGSVLAFELIAFFVTFVYLLAALYNDRKDRSILFWKSLPISETSSVLSKLLFAIILIPFVAILCSIPLQIVLGVSAASIYSVSSAFTFFGVLSELDLVQVFFIHVVFILMVGIKSLPLYSWLLLSSAASKRSPMLMAILVPCLILAVEALLFDTSYLADFLGSLFITHRFDTGWLEGESALRNIFALMSISISQLIKIAIVSGLFLTGAIWCRNNRFEI